MQLIGQYDSPFVRRVAIALSLYGFEYEHVPWSVWSDAERLAAFNPLRRVPVVVLDDGEVLLDSAAILDAFDQQVGPGRALLPSAGPERRAGLRSIALATGIADKAVSLLYERVLRADDARSRVWIARCEQQIHDSLRLLSEQSERVATRFWLGGSLGHVDIALACVLRFLREAHPGLDVAARYPELARRAAECEALEVFQRIVQPLDVQV